MKEFKSIGINLDMLAGLLVLLLPLYIDSVQDFFTQNIKIIIPFIILYALCCITIVKVNREGIIKELYLAPITLKKKTWREIKHYAHVTEKWSGQYGTQKIEVLWFIDFNDKVCLRIQKKTRRNLDKIMEVIDKFEDKYEIKLEIKDPYFMAYGYSKVKYPTENSDNIKNDENSE